MKERATIVCWQGGRLLLVQRERSRWSLPGGAFKRGEAAVDAALRELSEETSLDNPGLEYLFEFGGLHKRHHVFFCVLADRGDPQPGNEIVRCRWFRPGKIATLPASVPTREIVRLLFYREGVTPYGEADCAGVPEE